MTVRRTSAAPPTAGDILAAYCQRTGRSMRGISKAAGLGVKCVADIISGKSRHPDPDTLAALAQATGLAFPAAPLSRAATLADVLVAIEQSADLPNTARRDLTAAVRRHTRLVGQAPEALAADPEAIHAHYAGLAFRQAGFCRHRTYTNHLGRLSRAIRTLQPPVAKTARFLPTEWRSLLSLLKGWQKAPISRFVRFAAFKGVDPGSVDDALVAAFRKHLEVVGTHRMSATTLARKIDESVRAWNWCVDHFSENGWPPQRLTVPPDRRRRLPECDLSQLRKEFLRYKDWAAGRARCGEGDIEDDQYSDGPGILTRARPLARTSLNRMSQALELAAKTQVANGADPATVQSIAACVTPEAVTATLRAIKARHRDRGGTVPFEESTYSISIAKRLRRLATDWTSPSTEAMETLCKRVRQAAPGSQTIVDGVPTKVRRRGMTTSNATRLKQFADPSTVAALVHLPGELWREAEAGRRSSGPTLAVALKAQNAVALMILLHLSQMRRNNLGKLEDRHFRPPMAAQPAELYIPAEETKNRQIAIRRTIADDRWQMLQRYRQIYRPMLTGGLPTTWLFPSPVAPHRPVHLDTLSSRLTRTVRKRLGISLNLHLVRHLFGFLMLKKDRNALPLVAQALGHVSMATTREFYVQLDADAAFETYDKLLTEVRSRHTGRSRRRR